jgi:hypothetical protein
MKERNTSVLYIGMFLALVFMLGAMAQQSLNSSETIVLANEPPLTQFEEASSAGVEHGSAIDTDEVTVGVTGTKAFVVPVHTVAPANEVEEYILSTFGESGLRVAMCESSLNPKAKSSKSTAKGLFQIINGTWKQFKCTGDPLDAKDNVECAEKIYKHTGSWNTSGGWKASYECHLQD